MESPGTVPAPVDFREFLLVLRLIFVILCKWRTIIVMDESTRACLNARAEIFKALAHPSRLFIVEELAKGERCVCTLADMVGADVSTVSRHLTVLRNAGIIVSEKRANRVFYRLRVPCVLHFFGCVEAVLEEGAKERYLFRGAR